MQVLLGIDVGKTSVRVGVFSAALVLLDRWSIPSFDVPVAQDALRARLAVCDREHAIAAAGVSIFGPLQVDSAATNYGAIPESSDVAWSGINIPALVSSALRRPIYFDYDVNAGALAEATIGAAQNVRSFVYLSVGTGVGAVLFRGACTPGYAPQLGHMYVPKEKDDEEFPGSCRFHGACLQGLASGRAIETRWGARAEDLPPAHPAWDLEARYLARACANLIYSFPRRRLLSAPVWVPSRT